MSIQNQAPNFGAHTMSVHRPAWTSDDLNAFNHCYRVKRIDKNFFLKTHGFAKKEDLGLLQSIQLEQKEQSIKLTLKNLKFLS
ncbi:MAG: hypothetical protein ACFFCM_16470 [Promethearchaeota archaeon]